MFGAFSKAFLAEAADFNFLVCSFDEILLSWNMFSDFSEPTNAGIFCRRPGMHLGDRDQNVTQPRRWSTGAALSKQDFARQCIRIQVFIFTMIRGPGRGFCLILDKVEKEYCAARIHAQRLWGYVIR